jgi:hypothetical protein
MPKTCKPGASHKYMTSLAIIDPYHSKPHLSIPVNYFYCDIVNHHIRIGDIVYLQRFSVGTHNDFPQLSGNMDKSYICIFHNKHDYRHGLLNIAMHDDSQDQHDKSDGREEEGEEAAATEEEKESAKEKVTLNEEWEGIELGKEGSMLKLYVNKFIPWAVLQMASWTEDLFQTESLTDSNIIHTPIHRILYHLYQHYYKKSDEYNLLEPKAVISSSNNNNNNSNSAATLNKCDLIALVVAVQLPGKGDRPARLLLWDGTAHGLLNVNGRQMSSQNEENAEKIDIIRQELDYVQRYIDKEQHHQQQQSLSSSSAAAVSNLENASLKAAAIPSSSSSSSYSSNIGDILVEKNVSLGKPLWIESCDASLNSFLMRHKVGMWLKIRDIYLYQNDNCSEPAAFVKPDTHIVEIQPFFR